MPAFEPHDWYDSAVYYDIVFDDETVNDADFLEAVHAEHARTGRSNRRSGRRRVLEPACGSGRLVQALARRGWAVTGFDLADGMLRYARKRLGAERSRVRLHSADMRDFHFRGQFDLAHCLVSTFKYLRTEADARAHLECIARALAPGGVYVLGFHLTGYDEQRKQRERWVAERDGVRVVCNIQAWPPERRARCERVRSRMTVTEPGGIERRYETEWTFRTYSVGQVRALLRSVPALELVATHDFHHRVDRTIPFDGKQLDTVLVLRRKPGRGSA